MTLVKQGKTALLKSAALITVLSITACSTLQNSNTKTAEELKNEPGTLLIMTERSADDGSFTTRLFINEGYLHMSDSRTPSDFMVFNRTEQTIYNVTSEEKTILVIRKKPITIESPIVLDYQEVSQPSSAIPSIEGKTATHYLFNANGKHCYDAVTMPKDFMPDVVAAMREFRQVLAGEHATTVLNTPKDLLDACDLSLNVFYATKHMDHGLPIREWDRHGYQRFMKDYRENLQASEGTFDLPKDYKRYSIGDMLVGSEKKKEAMQENMTHEDTKEKDMKHDKMKKEDMMKKDMMPKNEKEGMMEI